MNDSHVNGDTPERHSGYGWVKSMRSPEALALIESHPNAYLLATAIALNAVYRHGYPLQPRPGRSDAPRLRNVRIVRPVLPNGEGGFASKQLRTLQINERRDRSRLLDTRLFSISDDANNERLTSGSRAANERTRNATSDSTNGKHHRKPIATGELLPSRSRVNEQINGQPRSKAIKKVVNRETSKTGCVAPRSCSEAAEGEALKLPKSIDEVVQFSLIQVGFATSFTERWVARVNLERPAGDLLHAVLENGDLADALRWAFRFIHFNNLHGWELTQQLARCLPRLSRQMRPRRRPVEVPVDWVPQIIAPEAATTV